MHSTGFRMLGADGLPQRYEDDLILKKGNLVVFAVWLRREVRIYTGSRERISVAINIDALPRR